MSDILIFRLCFFLFRMAQDIFASVGRTRGNQKHIYWVVIICWRIFSIQEILIQP